MSYEQPDDIPVEQTNNALIWHHTSEVIRELENELKLVGLKLIVHKYFKNEYYSIDPFANKCRPLVQRTNPVLGS
ncbi:hypothetical protein LCGC14_0730310 [marine sediment metagenome]|uniref:Uncharacterized protein n=1 Tax=marine sediment metagenome TaxID=412755 RepID=A0A0F9TGZ8_9ZZZZ